MMLKPPCGKLRAVRLYSVLPRFLLLLSVLLTAATVQAQHRLPPGSFTVQPGALEIHSPHFSDLYIFGYGWASGADLPDPIIVGQGVSVSAELLALVTGGQVEAPATVRPSPFTPAEPVAPAESRPFTPAVPATQPGMFEPATARISDVRFGGSTEIRVVFDIPELVSTSRLLPLTRQGWLDSGESLTLPLDGLLPPASTRYADRGVTVEFSPGTVQIAPAGSGFAYNVFAIPDPVRLVIDLSPDAGAFTAPAEPTILAEPVTIADRTTRQLAAGVSHQQFRYPTGRGSTPVHVLEVAPGAGQFRVVGSSREPATLTELARGSIVAINAGYFNTTTHDHIGLLRTGGVLDSLPSLGRAAIGFNGSQSHIARTSAEVVVQLDGLRRVSAPAGYRGIEVFELPGQQAGDRSRGVLLVESGVVTANRIGPLTVPDESSYAIAYDPEIRELALVEPGSRLSFDLSFTPSFFDRAQNAVEAGPLLVDGGQAAFAPELESFARGQRILDDYTSQAAIGIRPDGTILLVVADAMRAQDLVPLFLSLGASQAMRLDSGGSAALYAGGELLNRNVQRRIVSAIVLVPF